jgi:hypothetical protein
MSSFYHFNVTEAWRKKLYVASPKVYEKLADRIVTYQPPLVPVFVDEKTGINNKNIKGMDEVIEQRLKALRPFSMSVLTPTSDISGDEALSKGVKAFIFPRKLQTIDYKEADFLAPKRLGKHQETYLDIWLVSPHAQSPNAHQPKTKADIFIPLNPIIQRYFAGYYASKRFHYQAYRQHMMQGGLKNSIKEYAPYFYIDGYIHRHFGPLEKLQNYMHAISYRGVYDPSKGPQKTAMSLIRAKTMQEAYYPLKTLTSQPHRCYGIYPNMMKSHEYFLRFNPKDHQHFSAKDGLNISLSLGIERHFEVQKSFLGIPVGTKHEKQRSTFGDKLFLNVKWLGE